MAYLIGTDEAGYAPNLGPLVISSTVWRVADQPLDCEAESGQPRGRRKRKGAAPTACATSPRAAKQPAELDLYRRLRRVVSSDSSDEENEARLVVADSKAIYS